MGQSHFEGLFNPKSVAIFGASEGTASVGSRVLANVIAGGFGGQIVPVNPHRAAVAGLKCYPRIDDAPVPIDLAIVATPASTVAGILRDCGATGIANVVVLSAGFGETGEQGRAAEARLTEVARRAGVRFIGPNCVGVVRPGIGLNATFLKSAPPPGRLALVSQSGALISAIADWAGPHHLGCSALVSLGNSANTDFGDIVDFLANDPQTDAILLYVEGIKDARRFVSALRIAARIKPVIVLKAGRHAGSSKAANTHTGALMGSDDVFGAVLERTGAVRAGTFGELFAAAEILGAGVRARGRRLAVITNGAGAGVLAADRAGDLHIDLPSPSETTLKALNAVLPPYWSHGNPVDILGDAGPLAYTTAIKACLADPNFDGLMIALTPQAMTDADETAQALIDAIPGGENKPVLACWMGESSVGQARKTLSSKGIPDFTTPERAVEAFAYLSRHWLNRKLALETPGPLSDETHCDTQGAALIIDAALASGRTMLSGMESKAVLRAFNIPVNTTLEADSAAKALIAAETVGFPVVVKINSPDITHKSDIGGVMTNLTNGAEVQAAFATIVARARQLRPEAHICGVTVEPMADLSNARELVVGAKHDPVFGPAILFGAGGTMVEVLRDSAVSLPPLNAVLARRLIERTRVSRLLEAFRNRPPVDRQAMIDVLLRISDLVCELPQIVELDINPLLAGPHGVLAVDARITIARPHAGLQRYGHLAIIPYPRHLVSHTILTDGTQMTIRPIRPEDAASEQAFVRELSDEAKRFRFMHALNELTPEMLAQFTQIDYAREMALIALTHEAQGPVQQGVARYAINPDEQSCEFAIVVSDKRQHQGIGTKLMQALIEAARDHGLKRLEGTVLAENNPMLQLMRELDFTIARAPDDRSLCLVERWL